jgi:hypothetical protein
MYLILWEKNNTHKRFVQLYTKGLKFYKVLNKYEMHHYYQYNIGLNLLNSQFNDEINEECGPGGLYFTHYENIHLFKTYGDHVREVVLPWNHKDFDIVMIGNGIKFRANMIILGDEKYNLEFKNNFLILEKN